MSLIISDDIKLLLKTILFSNPYSLITLNDNFHKMLKHSPHLIQLGY